MDPIEELKTLREEARERLEVGKRAIDEGADGKLVATLNAMIEEWEQYGGFVPEPLPKPDEVDASLDELIAELESPDEYEGVSSAPGDPVTEENYLEVPMTVDEYLGQLDAMTVD